MGVLFFGEVAQPVTARISAKQYRAVANRRMNTLLSIQGIGYFFAVEDHFGEDLRGDGLGSVGEGVLGVLVDFDEEAVGAGGDRGSAHRWNHVGVPGALRRIDDDGQVGFAFDGGDDGEGEGVADVLFVGADAAFAEDDVGVAGV